MEENIKFFVQIPLFFSFSTAELRALGPASQTSWKINISLKVKDKGGLPMQKGKIYRTLKLS
jgi:hypothetical protein